MMMAARLSSLDLSVQSPRYSLIEQEVVSTNPDFERILAVVGEAGTAKRFTDYLAARSYTLGETIGSGASSVVFELNSSAGKGAPMAVKIYKIARLEKERVSLAFSRSQGEYLSCKLSHPKIVSCRKIIVDSEENPRMVGIVMDRVQGQTLEDRMDDRQLSFREMAQIGAQIGRAVSHLHIRGIMHCDLKAQNVLIDRFQSVRLADFGLARRTFSGNRKACMYGTKSYWAPEMSLFRSQPHGPEIDAWAFGVILYKMANRQFPKSELSFPIDTPPQFEEAVRGLLHPDPEKRMTVAAATQLLKSIS